MPLNRVIFSVAFSMVLSLSCLSSPDDYDQQYDMAARHRSYPITIWGKEVLKFVPRIGPKASVEICLHHLAGNAMHIISMTTSDEYFQNTRQRQMSHKIGWILGGPDYRINYSEPDDIIEGRNSKIDLKRIIDLFRKWENLDKEFEAVDQFNSETILAEQELGEYREQRKLAFRSHTFANPHQASHEDPSSVTYRVKYPRIVKKFG